MNNSMSCLLCAGRALHSLGVARVEAILSCASSVASARRGMKIQFSLTR